MKKAFTLIELLVVVAIIGILTAVGVTTFNGYTNKAMDGVIRSNHTAISELIKSEIAMCMLNGGGQAQIERLEGKNNSTKKSPENQLLPLNFILEPNWTEYFFGHFFVLQNRHGFSSR